MDGIDARLYSQEPNLVSNAALQGVTRALKSVGSAAVAIAIFAFALVLLQVGFLAVAMGFAMYTESFGPAF